LKGNSFVFMHDLVGCRFLSRLNASLRPCTERNGKEAKQATEVVATVRVPLELLCVLFLLLAAALLGAAAVVATNVARGELLRLLNSEGCDAQQPMLGLL